MSSVPTKSQVLSLYRQFMRHSTQFNNYNFSHYFVRRSRDAFKEAKSVNDSEEVSKLFQKAREELNVLERQSKISQMYSFDKLVVEPLDNHHRTVTPQ